MIVASRWIALLLAVALVRLHGYWLSGAEASVGMTLATCVGVGVIVVAAGTLVAVTTRTIWLITRTRDAVAALETLPVPAKLRAAVERTGVGRVVCLKGPDRAAFCAGMLRPGVYVTAGMVRGLRAEELDAVLLHEGEHAARRDPLRRIVAQAAAEVLFYMPLVGWWSGRQRERAELAADRAAVAGVGREPVAGALWVAAAVDPAPAVGFDGAAQARVAQLLGDELPRTFPSLATWLSSLAGLSLVIVVVMCVGQSLEQLPI